MFKNNQTIETGLKKYGLIAGLFVSAIISTNAQAEKQITDLIIKKEKLDESLVLNKLPEFIQENIAIKDTTKSNAKEKIYDFSSIEKLPEFVGGMRGWAEFIQANLRYPEYARRNNISGRVIVSFVVSQIGEISDIVVLRGIGGGCDEEAVRVLRQSPRWNPGYQYGKPVKVAYTMPIFFQLAPKTNEDNLSPFRRNF